MEQGEQGFGEKEKNKNRVTEIYFSELMENSVPAVLLFRKRREFMTTDEILTVAAAGAEPTGLDLAGKLLFCRMRESYRAYRAGEISKAEGAENRIRAMAEYRETQTKLAQGDLAWKRLSEIWTVMGEAASAYRKNPSLETADQVMAVVYGLLERRE